MKNRFLRYSVLVISAQSLLLGACLQKQDVKRHAAPNDLNSGEQSASLTSDGGCSEYFASGKDASLDASDISGVTHPICSVLAESRAQYLIVVPAYGDCASCEKYAVDLAAQSLDQGYSGSVKIALLLPSRDAALTLTAGYRWDSEALIFVDEKSQVLSRLSKLSYIAGEEKMYVMNKTSGALHVYSAKTTLEHLAKVLGLKKSDVNDSSNDISILVNWDGLTNVGEDGWNIIEIK